MEMMKAVVLTACCKAEDLRLSMVPLPRVRRGWVLIKVRAFGLNHAELILRSMEAEAPYIGLPRIPGIECAGEVADPSDSSLVPGQKVVALMGGMGRSFDGSYAEYTLVPAKNVFAVQTNLAWHELAAIPETWFTVYSALTVSLQLKAGESLFVRGATSAAGIAAIQLAKSMGCQVVASSRKSEKLTQLEARGADLAVLDDATLPAQVAARFPGGVNKVLELVGPATLLESMQLLAFHGIACSVGVLGKQFTLDGFDPIKDIPEGRYLGSFYSNYPSQERMDQIFAHIASHDLKPYIARRFTVSEIAQAHSLMESNSINGKIIVEYPDTPR